MLRFNVSGTARMACMDPLGDAVEPVFKYLDFESRLFRETRGECVYDAISSVHG